MGNGVASRLLQITQSEAWEGRGRGPRLRQLFGAYQDQDCWAVRRKFREMDDGNGFFTYEELQEVTGLEDTSLFFVWDIFSQQDEFIEARELFTAICVFSSASLSDKARYLTSLFDALQCGMNTGAEVAQICSAVLGVLAKCTNIVVKPREVAQMVRGELPGLVPACTGEAAAFESERVVGSGELDDALASLRSAYRQTPLYGPAPTGAARPRHGSRAGTAGVRSLDSRASVVGSISGPVAPPAGAAVPEPAAPAGIAGPPPEAIAHLSWLKKLEGDDARPAKAAGAGGAQGSQKKAQKQKPTTSAHVWMVIPDGDFAAVAKDLPTFKRTFAKAVSVALGLPSESVEVVNVTHGSIVVEFFLHPASRPGDGRAASALVLLLEQQIANPYSALRKGPLAQHARGAEILTGEPKRGTTPAVHAAGSAEQGVQTDPAELDTPRQLDADESTVPDAGGTEAEEASAALREALRELHAVRQRTSKAEANTRAVVAEIAKRDLLIEELRAQLEGLPVSPGAVP